MTDDRLTPDERRNVRIRKLLDEWVLLILALLIALIVVGGWLAYEPLVDPATEEREMVVGSFEEESEFTHQAEIHRSTPIFDDGEVVRNNPIYYTRLAPELEGTYEYTYHANEGSTDVVMDSYLLVRSVNNEGNEYWSTTESLNRTELENVSPGEEATVSFSVDVEEITSEIERIEEQLGANPGETESKVVVETGVTGMVETENIANRHTAELVINPDTGTYSVETETSGLTEDEFVETVPTEREYGPLRTYGPLGLAVLGLVGSAALVVQRSRGRIAPSEAELAALETAREREEFDEWISSGQFPETEIPGFRVEIKSLEELVDVAIDCDSRVIEGEEGYYVFDGDRYYTFHPAVIETSPDRNDTGEVTTFDGDQSVKDPATSTDEDETFTPGTPETADSNAGDEY